MIGYTTLGTNDMARAAAFYDPLLAELGAKRMMDMVPHMIAWGTSFAQPMVAVIAPYDGQPATVGNGVMVALLVTEPAQVDKLHAKALELGAKDEGAPGPRGDGFYVSRRARRRTPCPLAPAATASTAATSATWTATS